MSSQEYNRIRIRAHYKDSSQYLLVYGGATDAERERENVADGASADNKTPRCFSCGVMEGEEGEEGEVTDNEEGRGGEERVEPHLKTVEVLG